MDFLDTIKEKTSDLWDSVKATSEDFINEFKDLYAEDPQTGILYVVGAALVLIVIIILLCKIGKKNGESNPKKIRYEDIDWNIHKESASEVLAITTTEVKAETVQLDTEKSKAETMDKIQEEPADETLKTQKTIGPESKQAASKQVEEVTKEATAEIKPQVNKTDDRDTYYGIDDIMTEFEDYNNDREVVEDADEKTFVPPFKEDSIKKEPDFASTSKPYFNQDLRSLNPYANGSMEDARGIFDEAVSERTLEMEPISNAQIAKNIMEQKGLSAKDGISERLKNTIVSVPDKKPEPTAEAEGQVRVEQINLIKAVPARKYGPDNRDTNRAGRIFTEEELIKQIRE